MAIFTPATDLPTGSIKNAAPNNSGVGYLLWDKVSVVGGGGTGAVLKVTGQINGHVISLRVTTIGQDYTSGPGRATTPITGSGSGLTVDIVTSFPGEKRYKKTKSQSLLLKAFNFVEYMSLYSKIHARGAKSIIKAVHFTGGRTILSMNRKAHAQAARAWKNDLSPGERDLWKATAYDTLLQNYKGVKKRPTGFQLWMAIQKINYDGYMPTYPEWDLDRRAIYTAVPDPTQNPPPVVVNSIDLQPNGLVTVRTPYWSPYWQSSMMFYISIPPKSPTPAGARSHIACGTIGAGYPDPDIPWEGDLSWPLFPDGLHGTITFACRYWDYYHNTMSDFVWFRATPT